MPTTLGISNQLPALWAFALATLGLILSVVPVVWISFHRRRVLLARVEKDRFQVQVEHEASMRERETQHAERLFELETARKIGLREQERLTLTASHEQDRLNRVFAAELEFVAQSTRRMEAERDGQVSAVPAPQAPARAQVEKKAA